MTKIMKTWEKSFLPHPHRSISSNPLSKSRLGFLLMASHKSLKYTPNPNLVPRERPFENGVDVACWVS